MEDKDIVALFERRRENAISAAEKQYHTYLSAIANGILYQQQDAEECVNDALFSAWNSIPPAKPQNLKTYLGKLVRQTAIDRWRKNKAKKRLADSFALSAEELYEVIGDGDIADSLSEKELADAISAFLLTLSETNRKLFVRRYWYGDPIEALAGKFGFGISKVKMTLKRTRDALAVELRKKGYTI